MTGSTPGGFSVTLSPSELTANAAQQRLDQEILSRGTHAGNGDGCDPRNDPARHIDINIETSLIPCKTGKDSSLMQEGSLMVVQEGSLTDVQEGSLDV